MVHCDEMSFRNSCNYEEILREDRSRIIRLKMFNCPRLSEIAAMMKELYRMDWL